MSRLTLRLPETLHQQLANLAQGEGISLNQYIVYALTKQATSTYTVQAISQDDRELQQENFNRLRSQLRKADAKEIKKVLSQREIVEPESELTPEIIDRIKANINEKNAGKL
jgi:hypothetical protein